MRIITLDFFLFFFYFPGELHLSNTKFLSNGSNCLNFRKAGLNCGRNVLLIYKKAYNILQCWSWLERYIQLRSKNAYKLLQCWSCLCGEFVKISVDIIFSGFLFNIAYIYFCQFWVIGSKLLYVSLVYMNRNIFEISLTTSDIFRFKTIFDLT